MQIYNPIANPLFQSLMLAIAAVLGIGLVFILIAVTKKKEVLSQSSLFVRWRTWAILAPLAVGFTLSGPYLFTAWVVFIGLICTWEVCAVTKLSGRMRAILLLLTVLMLVAALLMPLAILPLMVASVFLVAVVAMMDSDGTGFDNAGLGMLTLCYVPLLGAHAIFISKLLGGDGLLLALITSSAIANVCAFTFGKLFGGGGKHKLSPLISPNKTWEGVAGSVVGAYIGFFVMSSAVLWLPIGVRLIVPLTVAIAGICGDLFESLMKRSYGVKDAGTWLPGFGGAMDRVDGLLFVLPCVYYLVIVLKAF